MSASALLIAELHARLPKSVLAVTGGGAGALGQLLAIPGGSRWLLEAIVPYSVAALTEFVGAPVGQACSATTADALAGRALDRARWLAPGEAVLGLGCTAGLASDRPKKGDHRVHLTIRSDRGEWRWSLVLAKDRRDRGGEERIAAGLIVHALCQAVGLEGNALESLSTEDALTETHTARDTLESLESLLHLTADGRVETVPAGASPVVPALLPGAFNPLHLGHWNMARAAEEHLGKPVAFELSVANVDKPELDRAETRLRLDQFAGHAEVWVTRAPRFLDKARLFPGAVFVVGVDTAQRIVDPRYYQHDEERLSDALRTFQKRGCRFLVACRADADGRCVTLADVAVPRAFADLFDALAPERFRWDISSTYLRAGLTLARRASE